MILMVQEINKTNFAGARVMTCYTCHRNFQGAPKTTPSLAEPLWRAAHARSQRSRDSPARA